MERRAGEFAKGVGKVKGLTRKMDFFFSFFCENIVGGNDDFYFHFPLGPKFVKIISKSRTIVRSKNSCNFLFVLWMPYIFLRAFCGLMQVLVQER